MPSPIREGATRLAHPVSLLKVRALASATIGCLRRQAATLGLVALAAVSQELVWLLGAPRPALGQPDPGSAPAAPGGRRTLEGGIRQDVVGDRSPAAAISEAVGVMYGLRKDVADGTGAPQVGLSPGYPRNWPPWEQIKTCERQSTSCPFSAPPGAAAPNEMLDPRVRRAAP